MSTISDYPGETVKSFKKIKSSDLKFNPMQLNKTFTLLSGSVSGHTRYKHIIQKIFQKHMLMVNKILILVLKQ